MKISELKNKIKQRNPEIESIVKKDIGYQIGKQIELARSLRNFTQIELAEKIGTRQSSISRIESGSSLPTISFLLKIAEAFNTYLVPPKFAFMENVRNEKVTYTAQSSVDIVSPYFQSDNQHIRVTIG